MEPDSVVMEITDEVKNENGERFSSLFKTAFPHILRLNGMGLVVAGIVTCIIAAISALPLTVLSSQGEWLSNGWVALFVWRIGYQTVNILWIAWSLVLLFGSRTSKIKLFWITGAVIVLICSYFIATWAIDGVAESGRKTSLYGSSLLFRIPTFVILLGFLLVIAVFIHAKLPEIRAWVGYFFPYLIGLGVFYMYFIFIVPYYFRVSFVEKSLIRIILHPILMELGLLYLRKSFYLSPYKLYQGAAVQLWQCTMSLLGRFMVLGMDSFEGTVIVAIITAIQELILRTSRRKRDLLFLRGIVRVLRGKVPYLREKIRKTKNNLKSIQSCEDFINHYGMIRGEMLNAEIWIEITNTILAATSGALFLGHEQCFKLPLPISAGYSIATVSIQLLMEIIVDIAATMIELKSHLPLLQAWRKRRWDFYAFDLFTVVNAMMLGLELVDVCTSVER